MALLQIKDTKTAQAEAMHSQNDDIAVGIDLGTSNSVVAYYSEDKIVKIIGDKYGKLIPSIVLYDENFIKVGVDAALEEDKKLVFKSIKRFMGKAPEDIKDLSNLPFEVFISPFKKVTLSKNKGDLEESRHFKIKIPNQFGRGSPISTLPSSSMQANFPFGEPKSPEATMFVTPEQISGEILKYLKAQAEKSLGKKITKAVITVPAYFDEASRIATKQAAMLAGLEVLRLINEPTAAALAYGLDEGLEGIYVIYDLGGGTFDVSILKLQQGVFKVLATSGDTNLGGNNIDELIANKIKNILYEHKIINKSKENTFNEDLSNIEKHLILNIAKSIKEELSQAQVVNKLINFRDQAINFNLTLEDFYKLISPILEKTIKICQIAMEDAGITIPRGFDEEIWEQKNNYVEKLTEITIENLPKDKNFNYVNKEIKGVVLVGGSTRIPLLQNLLKRIFGITPLCSINPDEVVAVGAAYQAANLTGKINNSLLLDVIPLSLGLETVGGIVEKIIPRNSLIPITKVQEFTTFKDGQTSMLIHVLQGERELVEDLRSLGKFTLKGIPPLLAGAARIAVTFALDADGLLKVQAMEKTTGVQQAIEIKPSWGLDFQEMRAMIEKSMEHAERDINTRLLLQAKTEAQSLIDIVTTALQEDKDLLSNEKFSEIQKILADLNQLKEGQGKIEIEDKIEELSKVTEEFAHKRMDKKISLALKGKNIKEIKQIIYENDL
ncbi:Fe-S protein assembly chaperone HscA [Candidatus Hepatincolaceae symbiont of Richtersius coronifer]